jgi:hypothetical protein
VITRNGARRVPTGQRPKAGGAVTAANVALMTGRPVPPPDVLVSFPACTPERSMIGLLPAVGI